MRMSDWSSEVCSSDLADIAAAEGAVIGIMFVEAHAERTSFEQLSEINTTFATAILMIFWGVEMLDADTQLPIPSTNFEAVTVDNARDLEPFGVDIPGDERSNADRHEVKREHKQRSQALRVGTEGVLTYRYLW